MTKIQKYGIYLSLVLALSLIAYFFYDRSARVGTRSVAETLRQLGPQVESRLQLAFARANLSYPPTEIVLLGFKQEKRLELWVKSGAHFKPVKSYDVQAASGHSGPKLREGDHQVPEGFYRIEYMNPNSHFHLSIKLNYPNEFDLKHAAAEGRSKPGTNIFIHGKAVSVGCLAMGDPAIEELFVLVNKVGQDKVRVILAPQDFRRNKVGPANSTQPAWLAGLYSQIETALQEFVVSH